MNDQPSNSERRQHQRLENNVPVRLSLDDDDTVTETVNISRSGAYCRVNRYIEPMTKVKVNILLPLRKNGKNLTKKVHCAGVVVRIEETAKDEVYNIAVFFNEISARDAESISDYISSHLEQEA